MKKQLILAVAMMAFGTAYAGNYNGPSTDCGGIGNCNQTVHNDNSVSNAGGESSSKSYSDADAKSFSGGNSQVITYQEASRKEINYSGEYEVKNVPNAPSMISNPTAPCRVAYSGSGSGAGFGLGIGGSVLDEGCDTREDARTLFNMGLQDAAVMRLCAKPEMKAALGARCTSPAPVALQAPSQQLAAGVVSYSSTGTAWRLGDDGQWVPLD